MKPLSQQALGPTLLWLAYIAGDISTFVFLTFLDDYRYTAWNWLIAVPVNFFLAQIWPIYWLILRPLFD